MNWILILALLGIVVAGVYYLHSKGVEVPGMPAVKVGTVNPNYPASAPPVGYEATGHTGYKPPLVKGSSASLVVPPSKGPAIQARSGKGAF